GSGGPHSSRPHEQLLHRNRAGVPKFSEEPDAAAHHRRPGGLYRPGCFVRKLRPPPHNPFRTPVRRIRRLTDPAHLQGGFEYLRIRGTDDAGGHCEEERHHADRLRAGRGAPREDSKRGDLSGLPGALPADHDDYDGGDAGGPADGDRMGRRQRGAPSAGSDGGRRPVRFPVDDAVPDACGVYVPVAAYRNRDEVEEPPSRARPPGECGAMSYFIVRDPTTILAVPLSMS